MISKFRWKVLGTLSKTGIYNCKGQSYRGLNTLQCRKVSLDNLLSKSRRITHFFLLFLVKFFGDLKNLQNLDWEETRIKLLLFVFKKNVARLKLWCCKLLFHFIFSKENECVLFLGILTDFSLSNKENSVKSFKQYLHPFS